MRLEELLGPGRRGAAPPIEGYVSREPDTASDPLWVVLDGLSPDDEIPCMWTPRVDEDGDVVMPDTNDLVVVVMTAARSFWAVGYWPRAYTPVDDL